MENTKMRALSERLSVAACSRICAAAEMENNRELELACYQHVYETTPDTQQRLLDHIVRDKFLLQFLEPPFGWEVAPTARMLPTASLLLACEESCN